MDSRKRRFALLLVGLVTLLGSLLIAGPAAAATDEAGARTVVSVQEQAPSFIGPQARPGCNSDDGPPANYFMLNHFTGTNVCARCNESAWYWYSQGYWTWCWDLSAYHAELWVKPR